jgi:hypothetical protein
MNLARAAYHERSLGRGLDDYYSEWGERPGLWWGGGAELLGLEGYAAPGFYREPHRRSQPAHRRVPAPIDQQLIHHASRVRPLQRRGRRAPGETEPRRRLGQPSSTALSPPAQANPPSPATLAPRKSATLDRRLKAQSCRSYGLRWNRTGAASRSSAGGQGFVRISLPEGASTYQRPPLRFRACPVAAPAEVSAT